MEESGMKRKHLYLGIALAAAVVAAALILGMGKNNGDEDDHKFLTLSKLNVQVLKVESQYYIYKTSFDSNPVLEDVSLTLKNIGGEKIWISGGTIRIKELESIAAVWAANSTILPGETAVIRTQYRKGGLEYEKFYTLEIKIKAQYPEKGFFGEYAEETFTVTIRTPQPPA